MVNRLGWRLLARDPDLNLRGDLPWSTLTLDHYHCAVSTWTVTLPATAYVKQRLGPGWGSVLLRDNQPVIDGPLEADGPRSWAAATDADTGTVDMTYVDNVTIIANELAWPNPALSIPNQITGNYQDKITGVAAETAIKHYISQNIGTGRNAERGDPAAPDVWLLDVLADQGRGDIIDYAARFDSLIDICQTISEAGSNLGLVVNLVGSQLQFDVYEPTDKSARMRFTLPSGTLLASDSTESLPTLTHAIVMGQTPSGGNSAQQVLALAANSAQAEAWRMAVAQTVDGGGTNANTATQLQAAGKAALAQGGQSWARDVTIAETAQVRYPSTITRGDIVTVVDPTRLPGDNVVTDIVGSVHVELDATQGTQLIQLNIGTSSATASGQAVADELKTLRKRVDNLIRRTATEPTGS